VLVLLSMWGFAAWAWPTLPERIPMHFGPGGAPDAWTRKSAAAWFLIPALATVFTLLLGAWLPRLAIGMARRNSTMLNMPQRERFRALPEAARVRAVTVVAGWLGWLTVAMQALFSWFLFASWQVAHERWTTLPVAATVVWVAAILALAASLAVASSRAVTREVAAAAAERS